MELTSTFLQADNEAKRHGALAVFDVTRPDTLTSLREWIDAVRRRESRTPVVVLGNKVDIADGRQISEAEAKALCQGLRLSYFPTSAKTGLNVQLAFRALCQEVLETFASTGPIVPL